MPDSISRTDLDRCNTWVGNELYVDILIITEIVIVFLILKLEPSVDPFTLICSWDNSIFEKKEISCKILNFSGNRVSCKYNSFLR